MVRAHTASRYFEPMDANTFSSYQVAAEHQRIIAAARALLLERGIAAVQLTDVALALRMPVAAVERQFPAGKLALVQASLEAHMQDIHARLLAQRQECSSAVEELLAMRRLLQQQIGETRSLFLQEIAAHYPTLNGSLQELRATFTLDYLRQNLQRGIREGYYRPELGVEEQAHGWLRQVDAVAQKAQSSTEFTEAYYQQFGGFLASITTALGAFVVRRLQETPPYY